MRSMEASSMGAMRINNLLSKIYPWIIITICGSFLIYKYILQVYPSIMTDELMRAFNIRGTGLGNLAATFFWSYLITQFFVGVLLDKYGVRFLCTLAIAVSSLGAFIFGQAHALWVAEISRALMGFGAAFATVSYLKTATIWFRPNQFAFITGLLATAAMTGAVFGEAPLSWLSSFIGWRGTLTFCAILGFIIALLFLFFVKDNNRNSSIQDAPHPVAQNRLQWKDVLEVVYNRQNWLLTFYSGLAFSPLAVFGGLWGNKFIVTAYHVSLVYAASLNSLIFVGLAIGAPIFGWVSDYLNQRRLLMIIGTAITFLSVLILVYFTHLPMALAVVLLFLFGFGTGAYLLGFAVGRYANRLALAATVVALINSGDAILGALTEPLIGKFLDLGSHGQIVNGIPYFSLRDYQHALLILPIYLFIAIIIVFFLKEKKLHNNI